MISEFNLKNLDAFQVQSKKNLVEFQVQSRKKKNIDDFPYIYIYVLVFFISF